MKSQLNNSGLQVIEIVGKTSDMYDTISQSLYHISGATDYLCL